MISIKIVGTSIKDAQEKFEKFFYGQSPVVQMTHSEVIQDEAPTKRGPGRPKKVVAKAEDLEIEEPLPELPEVRSAVQKVIDKHGIASAQKLILAFGKSKYSDLPKEKWKALIAACERACNV